MQNCNLQLGERSAQRKDRCAPQDVRGIGGTCRVALLPFTLSTQYQAEVTDDEIRRYAVAIPKLTGQGKDVKIGDQRDLYQVHGAQLSIMRIVTNAS
jgi:hypothetical protein